MSVRTLHIGCLWPSEASGGADRVLADLGKYLSPHGIDFEAVVAGPAHAVTRTALPVTAFAGPDAGLRARWQGARRAVCARVDTGRVDLVVSHFALYASAALDRLRRVPHVVHFHGPWAAEARQEGAGRLSRFAKWCIERSVYASADRVIVLSDAFAAIAERDYGVSPQRLRVVPGAADFERFAIALTRAEARAALGWPADRRILLSVRRLVQRMGLDLLVDALPSVIARHPDVALCIGGTGPMRGALAQRVAALGLERHVTLLGYVPDDVLPLVYRAADLNVVPARALEGFGLTVVEALAAGTPSMVTPVGGLPEIVGDLSPALIFTSARPAHIAEGLCAALSGSMRLASDTECRSFARARFSAEGMARRVADVYREVCGAPRSEKHVH